MSGKRTNRTDCSIRFVLCPTAIHWTVGGKPAEGMFPTALPHTFNATSAALLASPQHQDQYPDAEEEDQCPLKWWRERRGRFPVLYEMARVYLAIPASSAPSERVFSTAGLVLTDKRKHLMESRVARLMFMKRNMAMYTALTTTNTRH